MFATNGTSFFVQAKYDGWREAVVTDACFWQRLTDKPPAPEFVAYWTNNGQKAALGLDLSAAIDPKRTSINGELLGENPRRF